MSSDRAKSSVASHEARNMQLCHHPQKSKAAFEVFIPTWNSARTLDECLQSIKDTVTNAKIFLVDRFSTDETVDIAKKFGAEVHSADLNLGQARTLMCELARNEWFLMVDSDVYLGKDWFKNIVQQRDELEKSKCKVGAVQSTVRARHQVLEDDLLATHNAFVSWKETPRMAYPIKNPQRMLTCAVLLRKEACEGFHSNANAYEDYELAKHIQRKGFDVYAIEGDAEHDLVVTREGIKKRCRCSGAAMHKHGEVLFVRLLASAIYVPVFKAPWKCKLLVFSMYWNYLIGWVRQEKYGEMSWV